MELNYEFHQQQSAVSFRRLLIPCPLLLFSSHSPFSRSSSSLPPLPALACTQRRSEQLALGCDKHELFPFYLFPSLTHVDDYRKLYPFILPSSFFPPFLLLLPLPLWPTLAPSCFLPSFSTSRLLACQQPRAAKPHHYALRPRPPPPSRPLAPQRGAAEMKSSGEDIKMRRCISLLK